MRPLCANCQTEMKCIKNEVLVVGPLTLPRYGDLYECPGCKVRIVTGFGRPFGHSLDCEAEYRGLVFENHADPQPPSKRES